MMNRLSGEQFKKNIHDLISFMPFEHFDTEI